MKSLRAPFMALILALAALAPLSSHAGPVPDTTDIRTPWRIVPMNPCVRDSVFMVVRGFVDTPCDSFIGVRVVAPLRVEIARIEYVDRRCPEPARFFDVRVLLGTFPAGLHQGVVELKTRQIRNDGTSTDSTREASFGFTVAPDCSIPPPPPPPPGTLPYVETIIIDRDGECGPEPPCPGDSIAFRVFGIFPNNCYELRRIEVIPSPLTVYPPPPPTVRIIVDNGCCRAAICPNIPTAWTGRATLPPMRSGDYKLDVELAEVCCSAVYPPGDLHQAVVPFTVADSCDIAPPCLTVNFAPGPGDGSCAAHVATGQPAELTLLVRPSVALAGLQGQLRLDPPTLRITSIEPYDTAQGMLIDWTATDDGARFVLFSQGGAPIPPYTAIGNGWPVLRVVAEYLNRGGPPPPRTVLTVTEILGSDGDGGAVRLCPPPPCVDARLAPAFAVICGEQECDVNGDALLDVRDLVLMINCLNQRNLCALDLGRRIDCEGDSTLHLADVMCCARSLLQQSPCLSCTLDTVRPAPGVAVSFGAPEERDGEIVLPLAIAGADQVGGAMLTLEAPLDRYDVTAFDVGSEGNWITLHETRDGRIALGMIDLRSAPRNEAQFTLRLTRRPGQPAGGEVTVVAGEFSGPDGVALAVNLGRPSQPLPGGVPVALSRNQPNPFAVETAFTVDLAEAGDVDVGIYDPRGRLVVRLQRARLEAGPHVFRWDGRRTDGSRALDGVYFYQVRVGGKALARKLILIREN